MIDLEYTEIGGLLYPNIETGMENLVSDLSKYGILRLRYLHEHNCEMYREMLFLGKLAEHCKAIDKTAFEQSEQIQANWLKAHPMPLKDTLERIRLCAWAVGPCLWVLFVKKGGNVFLKNFNYKGLCVDFFITLLYNKLKKESPAASVTLDPVCTSCTSLISISVI